jgi:hypothetical protein
MDFNAAIDIIIKDLHEATEIIDDLRRYPGVPELQVELAKSKCKSAGEVIAMLKNIGQHIPLVKPEPVRQEEIHPHAGAETEVEDTIAGRPHEEKKVRAAEKPVPVKQMIKQEAVKSPQKETGSMIIADQFANIPGSFNEQLSNLRSDDDIADILKTKPLESISDAIGLNDKFLFIREIFNGDQAAYTEAVLKLDSADNMEDARGIILSYTGNAPENEAVSQLLELVKRKLAPNE